MKTLAIARRILQQFAHDKRTLALLFVAPLIVLWLMSVLLNTDSYVPTVATVELPSAYQQALEEQDLHIENTSSAKAKELLDDADVDAVLHMGDDHELDIQLEGSDATKSAAVLQAANAALAKTKQQASAHMM